MRMQGPKMENEMEKKMENDMESGVLSRLAMMTGGFQNLGYLFGAY